MASVTGNLSEAKAYSFFFEWKIENYFTLEDSIVCCSPTFSLFDCSWFLRLGKLGVADDFVVFLGMKDGKVDTTLTLSVGVKKADGTVEVYEDHPDTFTFQKDNDVPLPVFYKFQVQNRESELVPSGTLTLIIYLTFEELKRKVEFKRPQRLVELETLSANFSDLFIHQTKCDVTLKVQEQEFRVHKAVLVARSRIFAKMFEGHTLEEETGVVTIPDGDPDIFKILLQYLYTGKAEGISFETSLRLYITADKYEAWELESFCVLIMTQNLSPENVCDVACLANFYGDDELFRSVETFFIGNYKDILATTKWGAMLESNNRLAKKLLSRMESAIKKKIGARSVASRNLTE